MFRRREEQPAGEFAAGHFFWALGSLAQLFRIPFAAPLVAQACPPPPALLHFVSDRRRPKSGRRYWCQRHSTGVFLRLAEFHCYMRLRGRAHVCGRGRGCALCVHVFSQHAKHIINRWCFGWPHHRHVATHFPTHRRARFEAQGGPNLRRHDGEFVCGCSGRHDIGSGCGIRTL